MSDRSFIVAGVRTAMGAMNGALATGPAPNLGAVCIKALIERNGALGRSINEVIMGNVIGAGLGENARAALITRGLAELSRLAVALGGRAETVMGLSGLGDLLLTCTGASSRNFSLGLALGRGERLVNILAARSSVTEGVATAPALVARAAGVAAIGVAWGYHDVVALRDAGAHLIIERFDDLPDAIEEVLATESRAA